MEGDDYVPDEVRSPQEIARRALVLFGVVRLAMGSLRSETMKWLRDHNLLEALSPDESKFLKNQRPSLKQKINFSWQSERLIVLLWVLNLVEKLPDADKQCDTRVFKLCIPPFSEQSVEQFISRAILRSENELWEEVERTRDLHWQARDAQLNNRESRDPVDIEVVQERHRAINWVTGYCGLDWDEVTADT